MLDVESIKLEHLIILKQSKYFITHAVEKYKILARVEDIFKKLTVQIITKLEKVKQHIEQKSLRDKLIFSPF